MNQSARSRNLKTAGALVGFSLALLQGQPTAADPLVAAQQPGSTRIVSFAPSNTELLFSIGAGKKLVGVCSFCDYPPEIKSCEKVGSFTTANLERLARIKPDTVLLVSGQEQLAGMLKHNGLNVRVLDNDHLRNISDNLRALGDLTESQKEAGALATTFDEAMTKLGRLLAKSPKHPKVFYCVWPQPLLTVGKTSFLNDVITACGGTNIAASLTSAYPHFSTEKLLLNDPDVIVLPNEARDSKILTTSPWTSLRAVKTGRVYYLPLSAKDTLARPTLRIIDGILWFSQCLHPEIKQQLQAWHDDAAAKLKHR